MIINHHHHHQSISLKMFRFLSARTISSKIINVTKKDTFNVLGIETSCDDTAVAIVNSDRQIISEAIHLQQHLHEPKGGIVPNLAMASHQQNLPLVVCEALDKSNLDLIRDIDVI